MKRATLAAAWASLVLVGCDPDTAVFVEASIVDPSVTATETTFGADLTGSFAVELHLGPRASEDAQVALGAFSLQNADQTATLLEPLPVAFDPSSPIAVGVDSTVQVNATISSGDTPISGEEQAALCNAGQLVLVGTFEDSLANGTGTVTSAPFSIQGCPVQ